MTPTERQILTALYAARDECRRTGDYHGLIFIVHVIEHVLNSDHTCQTARQYSIR